MNELRLKTQQEFDIGNEESVWLEFIWDRLVGKTDEIYPVMQNFFSSIVWLVDVLEFEDYGLISSEEMFNDNNLYLDFLSSYYWDVRKKSFYSRLWRWKKILSKEEEHKSISDIHDLTCILKQNKYLPGSSEFNNLSIEREKLINEFLSFNSRLVIDIALEYAYAISPSFFDDFFQEWRFGLRKAVINFDPGKWDWFYTYAKWWAREAMHVYQSQSLAVFRYPKWVREKLSKINRVSEVFKDSQQNQEAELTIPEIMELTWFARETILTLLNLPKVVSLSDWIDKDFYSKWELFDYEEIWDIVSWEYCQIDNLLDRDQIEKMFLMSELKPEEIYIIRRVFWFPFEASDIESFGVIQKQRKKHWKRYLTNMQKKQISIESNWVEQGYEEIWEVLGVSRQRIGQRVIEIIKKIRLVINDVS